MAAAGWRRSRRERSRWTDPDISDSRSDTEDVRIVFGSSGEMGELLARLLADLESLRIQISDHTFPENEDEQRRLEAAELLISSACSFILLGLDQLIAEDATPFGPDTLGWLRAVQRWTGSGPVLTGEKINAAGEALSGLGPDVAGAHVPGPGERETADRPRSGPGEGSR